ncbi:hypothetical protein M5J15_07730 [Serratia symbiotica]|uniref:hypothetical protein n=1 Tax=Serratia symbiotica TaxID=138074 RepID=UPI001DA2D8A2|nr:hypothetical protein [Serratia symbiotica]NIG87330.1 hypothetical protein [Serratia symbiotica]USS96665.1 hypothetical protein M5J15_07730 [Serratia symbiotica]
MITEFSAAMVALKETISLAKTISEAKTDADVKATTFELQGKLFNLQSDCLGLGDVIQSQKEQIAHLKAKVAEFKNFAREAEGYILNHLESGTFVYSKKQIVNETEVSIHLCPHCFTKKIISILQPVEQIYFMSHCPSCKNHYQIKNREIGL